MSSLHLRFFPFPHFGPFFSYHAFSYFSPYVLPPFPRTGYATTRSGSVTTAYQNLPLCRQALPCHLLPNYCRYHTDRKGYLRNCLVLSPLSSTFHYIQQLDQNQFLQPVEKGEPEREKQDKTKQKKTKLSKLTMRWKSKVHFCLYFSLKKKLRQQMKNNRFLIVNTPTFFFTDSFRAFTFYEHFCNSIIATVSHWPLHVLCT